MSETTDMITDAATRLFSEQCTPRVLAEAEQGVFPSTLWSGVEDNGIASMLAAEAHGGIAASPGVALAVMRVAGRHAVPLPLAETMVGRWLLSKAGIGAATGPLALVVLRRPDGWKVEGTGTARVLRGTEPAVAWGKASGGVLVVVRDGAGIGVATVDSQRLKVDSRTNIAGEPRDGLTADGVSVRFSPVSAVSLEAVMHMVSLCRAGLICGALQRTLELSVGYACDRVQFGRPLAKFQAIQQQLAELAGAVASATAIANATANVVEGEHGDLMIAAMRARLAGAIDTGTAVSHQVHGAMGFTREYALHYYTRRLWAWRDEYDSAAEWRERLGRAFAGAPADELWSRLARIGVASGTQ